MITFLTVLKSGNSESKTGYPSYQPVHVYALREQIRRHYSKPHNFVCLTDFDGLLCDSIPLINDLPGWWSKIELFRPDIYKSILNNTIVYFDLDTYINGNITEFVDYPHIFSALHDPSDRPITPNRLWSGVMAWRGNQSDIYNQFINNQSWNMERSKLAGDQQLINDLRPNFYPIQSNFSGFVGYKEEFREDAKVIYFYGEDKPWLVNDSWIDKSLYDLSQYQ